MACLVVVGVGVPRHAIARSCSRSSCWRRPGPAVHHLSPPPPRADAPRAPARSRAPGRRAGTTFWVPAGRSLSWTSPAGQLVADDHREMGVLLGRRLELLAELATAELGAGDDARRPQVRGDPQAGDRVVRVRADDDDRRRRGRRPPPARRPGPRARAGAGRARSRSRCPASVVHRAAPRARRSGRPRRAPAAGPRDRRRRTRTRSACSSRGHGRGRASSRYGTPSASRCARTLAKCSAQASHRRSVMRGAAAFSAAIAGSLRIEQAQDVALQALALDRRQLRRRGPRK